MKPHAHTALWSLSVGAPWEIIRTRTRTTEGHAVDLYTKSGGIGAYGALLVLVPDFGIVVPILAAGTDAATAVGVAFERVVQGFLPVLEKAARQQTKRNLGGTYTTKGNSTLVLDVEDDPVSGLVVKQWISNGVDTHPGGAAVVRTERRAHAGPDAPGADGSGRGRGKAARVQGAHRNDAAGRRRNGAQDQQRRRRGVGAAGRAAMGRRRPRRVCLYVERGGQGDGGQPAGDAGGVCEKVANVHA